LGIQITTAYPTTTVQITILASASPVVFSSGIQTTTSYLTIIAQTTVGLASVASPSSRA